MKKRTIIVIAILLFFGLGTFVFANPSEAYLDESTENTYQTDGENDSDGFDDSGITNRSLDDFSSDRAQDPVLTDDATSNNVDEEVQTFVRRNVGVNNVVDIITGNNADHNATGSTSGSSDSTSGNTGSNNGSGNGNDNTTSPPVKPGDSSGETTLPENPDISKPSDKEDESDEYASIKKLVQTLQNKVQSAKSRQDVLAAKSFRDSNTIVLQVQTIDDETLKESLQKILDSINPILDDDMKPLIQGVMDQAYVKTAVTLSIVEEHIKEIKVNHKVVTDTTLTFSEEGVYEVVVLDQAYNKATLTFTIDKEAPVAIVSTSNCGEKTNKDVTVTIKTNEKIKPVEGWLLSSDQLELKQVFSTNTSGMLVIEDMAGNTSEVEYQVFDINKELPVVESNNIQYSTTQLTNGDVVVTITSSKPIFTPKGWTMVSNSHVFTKTFTENAIEKVRLKDAYQNIGYAMIEVSNIDKTPPVATFVLNTNKKTNQSVIGKIISNEPVKAVPGWISSTDGKELIRSFDENVKDKVVIEDMAGNQVEVEYAVSNIDREVSGIQVKTSNDGKKTNKDVTVTIMADEELGMIDGWVLSSDHKSLSRVFTENTEGTVVISDTLGNQAEVLYQVFDINRVVPQLANIEYSITSDNQIQATITTTKAIFTPKGWTMVSNSHVFTKIFTESTEETIRLKDAYRNRVVVDLIVDVDQIRKDLNAEVVNDDTISHMFSSVTDSIANISKSII